MFAHGHSKKSTQTLPEFERVSIRFEAMMPRKKFRPARRSLRIGSCEGRRTSTTLALAIPFGTPSPQCSPWPVTPLTPGRAACVFLPVSSRGAVLATPFDRPRSFFPPTGLPRFGIPPADAPRVGPRFPIVGRPRPPAKAHHRRAKPTLALFLGHPESRRLSDDKICGLGRVPDAEPHEKETCDL
jgi:hypothetical protein